MYAAWNDLLIDGRPADEDAIAAEFYAWDESKKKFSRDQILSRIAWMRQHGRLARPCEVRVGTRAGKPPVPPLGRERLGVNPTGRFSDRVADYVRSRPSYPAGVLDILRAEIALTPAAVIADVGSGTGISSALFLRNGNVVYGVEPNADMRAAADQLLGEFPRFHSVNGTAEATTLPANRVDVVVAGGADLGTA